MYEVISMPQKNFRSGYFIKCDNCGKEVYKTKSQYNKAKNHFCSIPCQKEFQHKEKYELRKCENCNKNFEVSKKSKQRFCCVKCQNEWQKTRVGLINCRFEGKILKCDNCGKEITVGKSNLERFDHHFCSNSCRKKWYSNVFSKSIDWKIKSSIRATELLKNNKPSTYTFPQQIMNNILDELKIKYINEENIKYYSLDNFLFDYNLAIEVMGDFWHCNPQKFDFPKNDIQIKRIPKDKAKHSYVKNKYGYEILYIWENDLYKNVDLCKMLVKKYVDNNGILKNYHSFNYHLENNQLVINDIVLYPFFEDICMNA